MFKKKTFKNKSLFFLLIIYTLSHIFFYTNPFYIHFLNPFFWFVFLILFYYQDLKLPKKKEINITLIISIIFLILYLVSGFLFGFNENLSNDSFISIFINVWETILPIGGMEILRYKLLRDNQNSLGFKTLITIIIILNLLII